MVVLGTICLFILIAAILVLAPIAIISVGVCHGIHTYLRRVDLKITWGGRTGTITEGDKE